MPTKKATVASKKAVVKKKAAPKEKPKFGLQLPDGIGPGMGISAEYSRELSEQKGLEAQPVESGYYGMFHGIVNEIVEDGRLVYFTIVYLSGVWVDDGLIDLETGIDMLWNVAIAKIQACPIPIAQLKKWQKMGEAAKAAVEKQKTNASAIGTAATEAESEEEEEGEEGGDEGNEGIDYQ